MILNYLNRLWRSLSLHRHKQFVLLLILMLLTSCAEIFSIGAVLPFLGVLTSPDVVFNLSALKPLIRFLGYTQPSQLVLPLTVMFGLAALVSGGMRALLIWSVSKFTFAIGSDLSTSIYRRTLYQPYAVHLSRNTSEVIAGITTKIELVIFKIVNPIISMIASVILLTVILATLIAINPLITIMAFSGFGLVYVSIVHFTHNHLAENGKSIAKNSTQLIKSIQDGLGAIRDVLINGSQSSYCDVYEAADFDLRRAQGNNQFLIITPKFIMEAMGMVLIAGLAFLLAQQPGGISKVVPTLGALALGSQRLLPLLHQLYQGWSEINGNKNILQETLDLLEQPLPLDAGIAITQPLTFKQSISLNGVSFRYTSESSWVLKNINFSIEKGSRIGLIGATGSGKSTLIDILMGLMPATKGVLQIDNQVIANQNNRAWQMHIAHVPQSIFLADVSIGENIALGVPKSEIDSDLVRKAANQAQIADFIESLNMKYESMVGERGVRISGGQRQRIGIARALYKKSDLIIFDEATSALDGETEQAVMQAIENLADDLTIVVIAHRITTLKNCDKIIELAEGKIKRMGSYKELFETKG